MLSLNDELSHGEVGGGFCSYSREIQKTSIQCLSQCQNKLNVISFVCTSAQNQHSRAIQLEAHIHQKLRMMGCTCTSSTHPWVHLWLSLSSRVYHLLCYLPHATRAFRCYQKLVKYRSPYIASTGRGSNQGKCYIVLMLYSLLFPCP